MVKIHGGAYLAIGVLIAIVSWYVKNDRGERPLILFLYVGGLFIFIGLAKMLFQTKKPAKPAQAKHPQHKQAAHKLQQYHPRPQHTPAHRPIQQQSSQLTYQPRQHVLHPQEVICVHCHARNHPQANFCARCGNRLKA